MIDTKEIRKALAIHGVDVLNVDEVLDVLDHLEAAYKEIESWKGLARQFGNEADELRTHLSFAKDELNRLRAKIAEMEKQEPVAMRTMIQVALEVLDNVRGNINPERGYADELEVDIKHAITTITSLAQRKTP